MCASFTLWYTYIIWQSHVTSHPHDHTLVSSPLSPWHVRVTLAIIIAVNMIEEHFSYDSTCCRSIIQWVLYTQILLQVDARYLIWVFETFLNYILCLTCSYTHSHSGKKTNLLTSTWDSFIIIKMNKYLYWLYLSCECVQCHIT